MIVMADMANGDGGQARATLPAPASAAGRRGGLGALPPGLKPHLRLFLSVDVVGSTRLKQSHSAWRPAMLSFYRDFDYILCQQYKAACERSNRAMPTPEFWKSNGDELLYTCELRNLDQAHDAIDIWLAALRGYRGAALQADRLEVKSTAWIGVFPAPNSEVFFRRASAASVPRGASDPILMQAELREAWYGGVDRGDLTRDFVGPSIDTGFRLTAWASPRRLIISVDLAFLLTSSYTWSKGEVMEPLPLHYSGREALRGVIDDEPYPAIWIPVEGEAPEGGVGRDVGDPEILRSYCEAVIERNYRCITPLFLSEHAAEAFDWLPPYVINRILADFEDEVRRRAAAA